MKLIPALTAISLAASPLGAAACLAQTAFVTVGTQGGPVAAPDRGQPANLLTVNGVKTLVDCGDGTIQKLAKLNIPAFAIDNVVITHLHFDHVGGLLAALGLRFQTNSPHPLRIYGPPGTDEMVKGLIEAMKPSMEVDYGVPGQKSFTPEQLVEVHVVRSGESFALGDVKVTSAENTHYGFKPGSPESEAHPSLSYRFETPDRTIVVTGDTGPSEAVEKLAKGADLLVGEMIDVPMTVGLVQKTDPHLDPKRLEGLKIHLSQHHLTPEQLAMIAAKAGVRELVVTHLSPGGAMRPDDLVSYTADIAKTFSGKTTIARDLEQF